MTGRAKKTVYPVLIILLTLLTALKGEALGERQNTRGIGMGRASAAVSYGLDAAGINPANLSLGSSYDLVIGVAPVGFRAGGDVLTYPLYADLFSGVETPTGTVGRGMTEEDKAKILNRFGSEGAGKFLIDIDARLLGVAVRLPGTGVLALSVTDYAGAILAFPRDLAEFVLYGNPLGSHYEFAGARLTASWMRAYTMSFGSTIPGIGGIESLSIGGGVKFVQGFAYYEILRSDNRLSTSEYGVLTGEIDFLARASESETLKRSGFDLFPDPSGSGWGFDIGITAAFTRAFSIGVSAVDLGTVSWSANTREIVTDTLLTIDNPLDPEQQEAVVNAISGMGDRATEPFTTHLPSKIRAGFALRFHEMAAFRGMGGELTVGADLVKGLYETPGSTTAVRVSAGVEYRGIAWLPVRAGVSSGGIAGTNISFGVGIHTRYVALDVATENIAWLVAPGRTSYGSLSFGVTLRL